MRTRRRSAVVVGVVLASAAWLLAVPAPTEASNGGHRADHATAEGYDFHTLTSADAIVGTRGNVVIRYTAGRAVDDGVLRIVLPRKSMPTDLHPVEALYETTPPGAFSVRPAVPSARRAPVGADATQRRHVRTGGARHLGGHRRPRGTGDHDQARRLRSRAGARDPAGGCPGAAVDRGPTPSRWS